MRARETFASHSLCSCRSIKQHQVVGVVQMQETTSALDEDISSRCVYCITCSLECSHRFPQEFWCTESRVCFRVGILTVKVCCMMFPSFLSNPVYHNSVYYYALGYHIQLLLVHDTTSTRRVSRFLRNLLRTDMAGS